VSFILLFLITFATLAQAAVPTPESHFGFKMGTDSKLAEWPKVVSYFQALEKSSDRIRVREIGKTALGRPLIAATIAAPATLKALDRYLAEQQRLADPRKTTPEEAARFIANGKAVVMITCSIHSTEVASTLTAVEFAWRMVADDGPKDKVFGAAKTKAILDNTIVILVPSLNPDGVDIVGDWYRKTLGTPYEGSNPPELYHKYVGHDNNRDWYIFSQPETRAVVSQLHNVWHPQIVYDVHQQGADASRMFVPPWLDPVDPNVDPILAQMCNWFGSGMAADLTAAGKTGVAINAIYDFWSPARHYQAYHGGMRLLSESASVRIASPITIAPERITPNALGYNPRERSWNYLEPWLGGEWKLRDIVDYQLIAFESVLYQAAVRREDLLRNFYEVGRRQAARSAPYAFVVSSRQHDPGSTRKLLETLAFGQVDIEKAKDAFKAGGKTYPAGSYVIRMAQPYSGFAKTLLERQKYPDLRMYPGGPPKRPYDVTAQTLPLLMGVDVDTVDATFEANTVRETAFGQPQRQQGLHSGGDIDSWLVANSAWKKKDEVWRNLVTGDFSLGFKPTGATMEKVSQPRIALYKSWVAAMDEGWTRWLLEQFGFAYTNVTDQDIQAGNLKAKFDVLVFPDQQSATMANGHRAGAMPPEYVGGLGAKGAAAIRQFVEAGGNLIFFNHASDYASDVLKIGPKNTLKEVSNREFYSPGSLLNVKLDPKSPLALGLPSDIAIWSEGSPAWAASSDAAPVARYVDRQVLASGWLLGESYLVGKSALLDVPVGQGHAFLFGMRPQYRAQSYQAFKLFFNALVYPKTVAVRTAMLTPGQAVVSSPNGAPQMAVLMEGASPNAQVPIIVQAQPRLNIAGVWKLNVPKSVWGSNYVPPKTRVDTITHTTDKLVMDVFEQTERGEISGRVQYPMDGKEVVNSVQGNPLNGKATYEGDVLVIDTWGNFGGMQMKLKDRYTLSEDGKTLTLNRHFEGRALVSDQKIIFEKQ